MGGRPPAATTSAAASSLRASRPSARMAPFLLARTCRRHAGRFIDSIELGKGYLLHMGNHQPAASRQWLLQTDLWWGPGWACSKMGITSALAADAATTSKCQ